ncbi:MAG: flagellar motor protein MotB [Lachnospiraceae bacterium]|nr:flagellar motor protein MotB [Lachnospiraceae bacterium]NBH26062.1 chemotaxis protein [Lachnospiraceae bacterium]GFI16516.1 motility protein B [Lachnospiraceae bacterium]
MANRKPEEPPKGAPAWQSTFADLMNLLLCFFVMLFSMSSVDAQKFEMVAASFNQTFSIFDAGAMAIGEGVLVGLGVSQLTNLDDYINSTGRDNEGDIMPKELESATEVIEEAKLKESEEMAERIEEVLEERNLEKEVDIEFTSQYVQLTLNGALLFDSGSVEIKEDALPLMNQLGVILQRFSQGVVEIEGHTDNVPMSGAKYSNNDELSSGRALSVFYFLEQNTALDMSRIKHAGRGEYIPIADNSTAEGRAKNRRVEIKIYNSLSSY